MKVKVQVTRKHIQKGVRCAVSSCPVANAVRDFFSERGVVLRYVHVLGDQIAFRRFGRCEPEEIFGQSVRTRRFIKRFDALCKVEPFAFFLDLKEQA